MTDFGKLLKDYQRAIDAHQRLSEDRNRTLHSSMRLSVICGDILIELWEFKKKYGETEKYKASMARYEELKRLNEEFDKIHMLNEKWRAAYKQLSDKHGSVCSLLEHTEKRLERIENEHRTLLLKL